MFKFFKGIFSPEKEEEPETIRSDGISSFLKDAGMEISADLFGKTGGHRKAIEGERRELRDLVDELSSKEREEAYHPKLEKVARNTLPLFRKSMLSSLSRDLPEDPEEFYRAASESLKGCMKGLTGPGRYLQGVFPEEMKQVRESIDRIGREMNAMTPAIAEARKRRGLIEGAERDHDRLRTAVRERNAARDSIDLARSEISVAEDHLSRIREQAAGLEKGAEAKEAAVLEERLEAAKKDLEAGERVIHGHLAVVSHVMRKAVKVVQRAQGGAAAKGLESAVDLMAASGIPDDEQLMPVLTANLPVIASMLKTGDISLKNKEEKEMFSPDGNLPALLKEDFTRLRNARSGVEIAEHACRESLYFRKKRELESESRKAGSSVEALKGKITALDERTASLDKEIHATRRSLESGLAELAGRKITLDETGDEAS